MNTYVRNDQSLQMITFTMNQEPLEDVVGRKFARLSILDRTI